MSETLLILSLTTFISFAGSVQPGPVNLAVVEATLTSSLKRGVWVALGGTLPEIIYASLAVKSHVFLSQHQSLFKILEIAAIPFFLVAGLISFYTSAGQAREAPENTGEKQVFLGFISGILNPQLLPFWLVVLAFFHSIFRMETPGAQISFVAGAAAGAFLLLLLSAWLARHYSTSLHKCFTRYPVNKAMGLVLILMSLLQTGKILYGIVTRPTF